MVWRGVSLPKIDTRACLRLPPNVNPTVERKVDTFGTIESQVEASVIAHREGDNELTLPLNERVRAARRLGKNVWGREERLVPQELLAIRNVSWEVA